jgi:putative ABC transport system permease protein
MAPEGAAAGLGARIDGGVLLFTGAVAAACGLLFGLAPAWQISRLDPYGTLKGGGQGGTAGPSRQRLRAVLVVGETALALVLLVGAGLFLRSLARTQEIDPGFDPRGVMTATLALPDAAYKEPEKRIAFYEALSARLAAIPGVSAAGMVLPLPFGGSMSSGSFQVEGRQAAPGDPGPHGHSRYATPGYFETMKIPLKSGRYFTVHDRRGGEPVYIVDENLARQYWPGENPVGKRMRRGSATPWATIVGVVGNVKHSDLAGDTDKGTYYAAMLQNPAPMASVVAKTGGDPGRLAAGIRDAVSAVDPKQPVHGLKSMEALLWNSLAPRRFVVRLMGFFAAAALFLAALGLYGVIGYSVARRTREIGIRMALGAESRSVLALVLGQGLRLAGAGVALGLAGALAGVRLLGSQLFHAGPFDPVTFFAMAAVLMAAALLASWIPARRATRVDPLEALRYE